MERSKKERIHQLIKVYAQQNKEALKEATSRISRRLGPQRTSQALEAIDNGRWEDACCSMLDYYDRCYDHELARSPQREKIDLSGLTANHAAVKLMKAALIY